jgi:hypothetical protein
MNQYEKHLVSCINWDGCYVDLQKLMEKFSLDFSNLSIDDVRYFESECRELRQKFEDADKVEAWRTYRLTSVGFSDIAYFSLDEGDLVKGLAKMLVEKGFYDWTVEKVSISKPVLDGHIRERKDWEKV